MQITHKQKKVGGWLIKLIIFGACGWFIMKAIEGSWLFDWQHIESRIDVLFIVFVLAIFNWGLEVVRWKMSLTQLNSETTWKMAIRQVFTGLALNWIMPFTTGDLVSRLLPNEDRTKVSVLIYCNRAVMIAITMVFGAYGIFIFSKQLFKDQWWILVLAISVLVAMGWLIQKIIGARDWPGWKWLVQLSVLSVIRYVIFTIQFVCIIYAFNPSLSVLLIFAGIGWIFLFRSIIPSLFGNLGVREASALVFFQAWVADPMLILLPSLLIWMINTVFPSLFGLYFLIRFPLKLAI